MKPAALLASLATVLLAAPGCMTDDGSGTSTKASTEEHEPGCGGPPSEALVLAAGFGFGECAGECKTDLAFAGADVTLTTHTWTSPDAVQTAVAHLSPTLVTELHDAAAVLDGVALQATYGCPDCADGGASYIELGFGDTTFRTTYEFRGPPAGFAAIDGIVDEITEAFRTCTSTADVTVDSCLAAR